jgi:copper transport protein
MNAGVYTITYHIISADGHAVNSTYVLTIGTPINPPNPIVLGHNHSEAEAIYSFRIVHYLMLLTLVGWIFWRPFISFSPNSEEQEYRKWLRYFCHFNLFFQIQVILLQSIDSIDDITIPNIMALWTGTSIGISWICTLVLSIMAYLVIQQRRWITSVWIILILVAQTFSGHAFAADPPYLTLFLDWIHLMSASIWIGGLLFIMIFFKNHRTLILDFLPQFSKGALICLLALISTGTWYALILVPKLEY